MGAKSRGLGARIKKYLLLSVIMPPRWPRQPDRADPAYRKLDDRMNFATHVAIFSAINSGLWFFRVLGTTSDAVGGVSATPTITEVWALLLVAHALYVFAIARYPDPTLTPVTSGTGFASKSEEAGKKSSKSTKR